MLDGSQFMMGEYTLQAQYKKVVLDAGVAIRLHRPELLGEQCYITPQVLNEIKDSRARAHLTTYTVPLKPMEPTEKDLKWVRSFATKTGDIGFLSNNDISIIALTYMLQRMTGNVKNLKTSPASVTIVHKNLAHSWAPPKPTTEKGTDEQETSKTEVPQVDSDGFKHVEMTEEEMDRIEAELAADCEEEIENDHVEAKNEVSLEANNVENNNSSAKIATVVPVNVAPQKVILEVNGEEIIEELDPQGGDWITPENFKHFGIDVRKDEEKRNLIEDEIALVSTDFSVQNVAIQMGLAVCSVHGMRIKSVKLWAQICDSCKKMERDTTKLFCANCGMHNFRRVPLIVDQKSGEIRIHDNPNRKINLRGINYTIPKHKGGRNDNEIIFCEEQLKQNNRKFKYAQAKKRYAQELAEANPFNEGMNYAERGWWGAAKANIGGKNNAHKMAPQPVVGMGRGNPNSNTWQKRHANK